MANTGNNNPGVIDAIADSMADSFVADLNTPSGGNGGGAAWAALCASVDIDYDSNTHLHDDYVFSDM